jgi:two-component system chemotaxis response regulator CheB/chemosensory pili system protein ChpB (putative protein-glutamate methylesterase)
MSSADPALPGLALVREPAQPVRHLADALAEIGATPRLEVEAAALDSAALADAGVEVLVVALGGGIDPPTVVTSPSLRIVFDDLDVSAGLTGWDRARWLRHLRAKILGARESGPPRPAGASPIPARREVASSPGEPVEGRRLGADADGDWRADHWPAGAADAAASGGHLDGSADGGLVAERAPDLDRGADHWADDARTLAPEPTALAPTDEALPSGQSATVDRWEPELAPFETESRDAGELPFSNDAGDAGDVPVDGDDASLPAWSAVDEDRARSGEPVGGLDDLLDALRRESPAEEGPAREAAAPPPEPPTPPPSRAFDLSSLSLEPLDHERPVTGRARFVVDEPPMAPAPAPIAPALDPPTPRPGAARALTAWLVAAGDGDAERVGRFAEALPEWLALVVLLVRPASAPWFGAELALDHGGRLPMVLADETIDLGAGRIVVMAPGERAGFDRSGRLTVQPGDPAMPEALGDWMTMRALAARYGRDTGVIVFGRLRDELLEGAIEVARAGGQVWFESSVLEEPDAIVESARAAGIVMRTGSPSELAAALVERCGR